MSNSGFLYFIFHGGFCRQGYAYASSKFPKIRLITIGMYRDLDDFAAQNLFSSKVDQNELQNSLT